LAGVPLLALVAIRDQYGEINPKAWVREYDSARDAIISRSLSHRFTNSDFGAIATALNDLEGLGNRRAWAHVKEIYGELLYRRLIGDYTDPLYSALDDLGEDDPARSLYAGYTYLRDQKVRDAVLKRANGHCEYCGDKGFLKIDGTPYLETHHVIALAKDGKDRVTNVIGVCANDHRKAHFGADREQIEVQMLAILRRLNQKSPAIHL
jgi:hypothetical protein